MGKRIKVAILVLAMFALAGCGQTKLREPTVSTYPREAIEFIAPAGSGGGYDLTIRAVAKCLQQAGLLAVPGDITNIPGGGGGVALSYLAQKIGDDSVVAVYSPPLLLIHLNGSTELNYRDNTTPIARLMTDCGCFVVRKDSPFQSINDVMDALKADPTSVILGGTSSYGSMDHVQFLKIAQAAGVQDLEKIPYKSFQNGAAFAQLLGGKVDLVSTGISDATSLLETSETRVLAITAAERIQSGRSAQIPTCMEEGIPATFINWRGLFGPKDMSVEARAFWDRTIREMVKTPQWAQMCSEYGWKNAYANAEEFSVFLDEMDAEYAQLLDRLNLPHR